MAIPLRPLLGAVINVDQLWAAAAVPVTSMLWMIISVERGALQGFSATSCSAGASWPRPSAAPLRPLLVGVGLDVTGAFLATPLALIAVGLALFVPLHRRLPRSSPDDGKRLRDLLAGSGVPVVALTLLFALQEVHVIVVKHEASSDAAGSYAVAAVAAKAIIWVAVGLGMYLLPEAARRAKQGTDARPILLSTLALIAAASVPMVLIYAAAARPLLGAVFGDDLTGASGALPVARPGDGPARMHLPVVQYLLALGRASFIWVLAPAALAEVVLLAAIGANLTGVAVALFGLQLVCATTMLALALRYTRPKKPPDAYLPV